MSPAPEQLPQQQGSPQPCSPSRKAGRDAEVFLQAQLRGQQQHPPQVNDGRKSLSSPPPLLVPGVGQGQSAAAARPPRCILGRLGDISTPRHLATSDWDLGGRGMLCRSSWSQTHLGRAAASQHRRCP